MLLSLQDGRTALMMASWMGRMKCVKELLDKGADVNMQDKVSVVLLRGHNGSDVCSECLVYWTLVICTTHPLVYICLSLLFNKTVLGIPFNGTEQKHFVDQYVGTPTLWYKLIDKSLVLPV